MITDISSTFVCTPVLREQIWLCPVFIGPRKDKQEDSYLKSPWSAEPRYQVQYDSSFKDVKVF